MEDEAGPLCYLRSFELKTAQSIQAYGEFAKQPFNRADGAQAKTAMTQLDPQNSKPWSDELAFATRIAHEAGQLTLQYFRRPDLQVECKEDGSPVSQADQKAERLLRDRIASAYPKDAVLGEEEGLVAGTSGRTWILDPIDGTQSFVHGVPLYGTLVALEEHDEIVVGAVAMPAVDELVAAARGLGAHWSIGDQAPLPARVSQTADPREAVVGTTSARLFLEAGVPGAWSRLVEKFGKDRGWGDAYGHMLVATGRLDAMVDPIMNVWDNAALKPIVEEAGGVFSDMAGNLTAHGTSAVSCNLKLHGTVLDLIRG